MRATKLADLANRSANNKYGRPPDAAGPGRRPRPQRAGLPNNYGLIWTAESCYGSEGWGFESLRARQALTSENQS
jgi:hypothetical protein